MPTYVSVPGTRTVIIDPFNPINSLVCGSTQSQGQTDNLDGDVRYYAGGEAGAVMRMLDQRLYPITLRHLSSAQVAQLVQWRGTTVLLRTVEGLRMFAVYWAVATTRLLGTLPEDATPETVTFDAEISFERVSFDETLL